MRKIKTIILSFFMVPSLSLYHNVYALNLNESKGFKSPSLKKIHHLAPGLSSKSLSLAINAYNHANEIGQLKKPILTIIDYSLPSSQKRMWIFDINHNQLLFNTYVAHGQRSGELYASHFSNIPQTKESSIGTYLTQNTYIGGKGYSLNLKGLESISNSNAFKRRIVMHGAWYMEESFIHSHGRAGRSWGCPAVSRELAKPIINTIKNGSIVFGFYPDKNYLNSSNYTHNA